MQSRVADKIPRFGWEKKTLIDDVDIGDGGGVEPVVTPRVLRTPGMFQVAVQVSVAAGASAGTGTFGAILEGSNTGDMSNASEWFEIASLNVSNGFTAGLGTDQTRLLGNARSLGVVFRGGSGNVNVGRFRYLRVRSEILSGASTFTMTVRMTGIGGDGEAFQRNFFLSSASGSPNAQTSAFVERPAGARWMTATALLTALVMDPAAGDGFLMYLEGALDREDAEAGNFVGLMFVAFSGSPPVVGDANLFNPMNGVVLDMGPFNFFRVRVENITGGTVPTDLSSYTFQINLNMDDNDWINGEEGLNELSSTLQSSFIQVVWGAPEAQVGDTVTIPGQIVNGNGIPLGIRRVKIVVSDDPEDKDLSPHPTATLTSPMSIGSVTAAPIIAIVSPDGDFSVILDSNAVPTTGYVSALPYIDSPAFNGGSQYVLTSSEIVTVTIT